MKTKILKALPIFAVIIALAIILSSFRHDSEPCEGLNQILNEEIMRKSKIHSSDSTVRIIGCQEKDAYSKALNLCIKLNAKKKNGYSSEEVFSLPSDLGSIIVQEIYNDSIFLRISFATSCENIPFQEIEYVSLKYYNKIR